MKTITITEDLYNKIIGFTDHNISESNSTEIVTQLKTEIFLYN